MVDDNDIDILCAQMTVLQERMGAIQDVTPFAKSSEFVDDWWTPIKAMRPDEFLGSMLKIDGDLHMTSNSIWTLIMKQQDRKALFNKVPETIKSPKLSDEAWAIVRKDKTLEAKANGIR
jgi:hypothetical protein